MLSRVKRWRIHKDLNYILIKYEISIWFILNFTYSNISANTGSVMKVEESSQLLLVPAPQRCSRYSTNLACCYVYIRSRSDCVLLKRYDGIRFMEALEKLKKYLNFRQRVRYQLRRMLWSCLVVQESMPPNWFRNVTQLWSSIPYKRAGGLLYPTEELEVLYSLEKSRRSSTVHVLMIHGVGILKSKTLGKYGKIAIGRTHYVSSNKWNMGSAWVAST